MEVGNIVKLTNEPNNSSLYKIIDIEDKGLWNNEPLIIYRLINLKNPEDTRETDTSIHFAIMEKRKIFVKLKGDKDETIYEVVDTLYFYRDGFKIPTYTLVSVGEPFEKLYAKISDTSLYYTLYTEVD